MARRSSATVELSRAAIVQKALEIIDGDGIDAVTIRGVAQEFGVTPMALYWHFANKEALLDAVGDSFFIGLQPPPAAGRWSEQLRAVVDMLVDRLKAHPGAAGLALRRSLATPDGLLVAEFVLALLRRAGFSVTQAADVTRLGLQTAIMLVTQFPGSESQAARDERDEIVAEKRRALTALPADRFPSLVEAAGPLTDCTDEKAYYAFGVDLYVEGAKALHRQRNRG